VVGGGGFSSRLMTRLRAEAGLTYGVWAGFVLRRQPGPFLAATFTRVSEARRVVDLVLAELERGREEPPSEQELQDTRALAVGRFSLGLETSDAVMAALVELDIYGLPEDALDTYRGRVRATTQAAVAKTARELLHPERAAIILVGPAERLVPQFEDLGSVEVVQPSESDPRLAIWIAWRSWVVRSSSRRTSKTRGSCFRPIWRRRWTLRIRCSS
jgi:zinc protease